MEYKGKILVLDERVYKGKQRLYISAAEGVGIIKVIGQNLQMLGVYSVHLKKGRNLYYILEAEQVQDFSYILRNPVALDSYNRIYRVIYISWPQDRHIYDKMLNVIDRLERSPQSTLSLLENIITDETDGEELLATLISSN